jgi:branched-chain amino acid transport system permease protein
VPLVQAIIDGLLIGGVYALISIGLTLVYGVMGIVNFAQAEFLAVGMFTAWFSWQVLGLDPVVAAPLAFAAAFAMGWMIQMCLISRVLKAPPVAQIFLTVGLLIAMENGFLLLFGSQFRSVTTATQTMSLSLGPFFLSAPYLVSFAMAMLCGAALWWFMRSSWYGRAMRATAQNPVAAQLVGINTALMYRTAFALGVGLTALGGAIILPYTTVYASVGTQFVVLMFTAVVLGGLGSIAGAVAGGLAVGVIQAISGLLFPIQLQNLVLFVAFIAVLALRPEGLVGARR